MLSSVKRIWMIDDESSIGARILMRGLAEGLREHGYDLHVFHADHKDPTVCERMKADLLSFDPELIFLANHPIQQLLNQINLESIDCPTIVWLFDDPYIMGEEPFQPNEIVLAADPSFMESATKRGAKQVYFVPVAAPPACNVEPKAEYSFPIVYAGSIFVNQGFRDTIHPNMQPVIRELIQRKLQNPAYSYKEILKEIDVNKLLNLKSGLQTTIGLNPGMVYFLYTECNRHWRLQMIKALEPLGIHLFGNQAWLTFISKEMQKRFHPPIDAFSEYPRLVRSAQINININSLQGTSAPTLRDFQVPFYGGFQLSAVMQDRVTDWQEHDPQNRFGLDTFPWSDAAKTPNELYDLTQYYLDDSKARQDWIKHAKSEIEKHHTFAHRIEQINQL